MLRRSKKLTKQQITLHKPHNKGR
uniref:Uncharacterized protein n=1 Tax=Arundo donax TaxID=35708 RepID=A0A0A9GR38_ARUDO